jgi:hypothetical protein
MRPRKLKLPLTMESIRFLLEDKRARGLGELAVSFAEPEEEVEALLRVGVALGVLLYFPPSRDICAKFQFKKAPETSVAGPRISPLEPKGQLKYDLMALAKLNRR